LQLLIRTRYPPSYVSQHATTTLRLHSEVRHREPPDPRPASHTGRPHPSLAPNGGYSGCCAAAYDYWTAAGSYGKGDDKDYNQERDGYALIAKIVNGDPKQSGGHWKIPFWAGAHPTLPPAAEPEPEPPRKRAHRPKGDREKNLARVKRDIRRKLDDCPSGRIYYYVADLADD
jgi:hypothetical protein